MRGLDPRIQAQIERVKRIDKKCFVDAQVKPAHDTL